jgi:beta-lactamase regulating signal transducer with metallopeptidase domain
VEESAVPESSRLVLIVGAWLLTYLIHSTVLLGGTALLSRAMGRHFERIADTAWRLAMFGAVATTFAQLAWLSSPATLLVLTEGSRGAHAANDALQSRWSAAAARENVLSRVLPALLIVWSVTALIRLVNLVRAYRAIARTTTDRIPLSDATIAGRVRALSGTTIVRVSTSQRILTPMVIGHRELCLPERALRELPREELDAVLAHEIAHIARRDRLWLSLAALVERILVVQPLNTLAVVRMRAVAECSCDDWALGRTGSPIALASALARVTEWLSCAPSNGLVVGMASRESLALARVRRILDPSTPRYPDAHRALRVASATAVLSAMILLAPGVSAGHAATSPFALQTPATRYTIRAHDDGGAFTLTLDGGRAVAMTIDGVAVSPDRLVQSGDQLRVTDARGETMFGMTLTPGGIHWTSRPRPLVATR